jgi:hypothetical protein
VSTLVFGGVWVFGWSIWYWLVWLEGSNRWNWSGGLGGTGLVVLVLGLVWWFKAVVLVEVTQHALQQPCLTRRKHVRTMNLTPHNNSHDERR